LKELSAAGEFQNTKRIILTACMLFNLSIGVIYAWSVLASKLTAPISDGGYGWTASQAGLPYSTAIMVFATAMLIGGRLQDKVGPRRIVTAGGALVGSGLILAGLVGNSVMGIVLSFGVVSGTGMGFGYSGVTPPALKWFHPSKKGVISGLIVGGFGLSAMYYAPLANTLLHSFGIERALLFLGIATIAITVPIAQLVKNPPSGYVPETPAKIKQVAKNLPSTDYTWREMMKTRRFFLMFLMFLLTSSVALMIIGNISRIAQTQAHISNTALLAALVSFHAVSNTLGRVAGGMMSDKIGRINALFVTFTLQMLNMAAFAFYQNLPALLLGIVIVGFCFGTLVSVMPVLCADQYGLKNFGLNYGIIFLAWGFAGITAPIIANIIYDATGSFNTAYIICVAMMGILVAANFVLRKDVGRR